MFDIEKNKEMFNIIIKTESSDMIFERRVYSLGDLIGQLGGFYSALFFFGKLLMVSIQSNIYFSSILGKLYFENKKDSDDPSNLAKSKNMKRSTSNISDN